MEAQMTNVLRIILFMPLLLIGSCTYWLRLYWLEAQLKRLTMRLMGKEWREWVDRETELEQHRARRRK
jgi:hypothetical protein